jgi:hypothetical protein
VPLPGSRGRIFVTLGKEGEEIKKREVKVDGEGK